jgi:hypothetical protein
MIKINRDSLGRFTFGNNHDLQIYSMCIATGLLFLAGLFTGSGVTDWWVAMDRHFQSPIGVTINQGDIAISITKPRPILVSTYWQKESVLSPIATATIIDEEDVSTKDMSEVEKMIYEEFGPADYKVARAVAKAESGLREQAFGINTNNTIDVGVFQINSIHFGQKGCSFKEVLDARSNIKCAHEIQKASGWTAWSVFNSGVFAFAL